MANINVFKLKLHTMKALSPSRPSTGAILEKIAKECPLCGKLISADSAVGQQAHYRMHIRRGEMTREEMRAIIPRTIY